MRAVLALFLLYTLLVGGWMLARLHWGYNGTFDLGIHDQAVWLVWHGENPLLTSRGLQVQADHFSPIAYGLAPLFALWDAPDALVLLQTVWLGAGVFPVYGLALSTFRQRRLAQGMALLYLLQPALLFMNQFDFHFSSLMTTPLLWACYALQRKERARYYCALLTALATSETAAICALGLVPVALFKASWRRALATLLLAVAGLSLSFNVVRWHNHGKASQYANLYSDYGTSAGEVVRTVLLHPWQTLERLNTSTNRRYALELFGPLGFTPLLAPVELFPATPTLAGNLLSWRESQHSVYFHYQAGVLPFLLWAACVSFAWLERRFGAAVCARLIALCCLLGFLFGPMWPDEWEREQPAHARALADLQRLLPADASLSVENSLGGVLSHRARAYLFPNPLQTAAWGSRRQALVDQTDMGLDPATPGEWRRALETRPVDYIVAEPGNWAEFPFLRPDRDYYLGEICACPGYRLVYARNAAVVFHKQETGPRYGPWVLPRADFNPWKDHLLPPD